MTAGRAIATRVAPVIGLLVLYSIALEHSPVYLLNDEVYNALHALHFAETGRSIAGDRWPLYFRGLEFAAGRDPLCVYATAVAFELLGVSELAVRLPTVLVGISNVVLSYFIGHRLWGDRRFALLAAAAVALAPAHYINSRIGIPTLWSTPWLLAWLLGVITYAKARDSRALVGGMCCLGIATFGYLGNAPLVPIFYAGTLLFMFIGLQIRDRGPYLFATAAVVAPLTLLIYWHQIHPERWSELSDYYLRSTTVLREGTPLFSPSGVPNFAGIQERVTAYWNYFNPTLLFLSGDASPRYSTGRSGVLLLSSCVLLPFGLYRAAHAKLLGRLLVFCFLAAPAAAAVVPEVQIQRALPLVVFGALISAWGAVALLQSPHGGTRRLGLALCAVGVLQFGLFAYDYFGHYRLRSGAWRGGNLRGAFERVIHAAQERERAVIYLDRNIANVGEYWRFYAVALQARELAPRAVVAEPSEVRGAPVGSLFITGTQKGFTVSPAEADAWHLRERIYELDGPTFFSVFEKLR